MRSLHYLAWLVLILATAGQLTAAEPRLEANAFAPQGMVGSVVGIDLDDQGRVYVTQTKRRTYGALDIRKHMDWVVQTLQSQSVEDKRTMIKERFHDGAVGDANADGVIDWHDLTVPSEMILVLEDTDRDGVADRKQTFAEGFNTEITGLAGSVLAHGDSIYTTIIPSLWHLRDTDGDSIADERSEIVTGFGLHVAYGGHDMHGLTPGPDGRIYWSIGDKALSVTDEDGGHHHFPYHGAIMRCEPDGSHFEVFAKGLRNAQELAFNEDGHLFVVDNDGDFGDQERFHYIVEGSDTGWRAHYQYRNNDKLGDIAGYNVFSAENLWKPYFHGQSAAITPCIANFSEGPAGFTFNPGTALSEALAGHFFLTEFPGKRLQAFRAEPDGAGYRMTEPRLLFGGQMLVGINFGPDGALYAADWGENEWVPHENGRILRLDVPLAERHPLRSETQQILHDGMAQLPEGRLLDLLGHPDQRVRLAAQFDIVRRGDFTILKQTALTDSRLLARIHAIWGCAQLARTRDGESLQSIAGLSKHPEARIREQLIHALGDTKSSFALEAVKRCLSDASPQVRLQAGLAMHHLAGPKDLSDITQFIAANASADVFLRHAGVRALTGAARGWPELLADLHTHASVDVRLSATIAIRRLHETAEETKTLADPNEFSVLARFLQDTDENVVMDTARGIHDVRTPSPDAMRALAALLVSPYPTREPLVRRAINANRWLGDGESANRLLAFAATTSELREEALQAALTWNRDLPIDRVVGFARLSKTGEASAMQAALDLHFKSLSTQPNETLVDLIAATRYAKGIPLLLTLSGSDIQNVNTRVRALEALVAMAVPGAEATVTAAAQSTESTLRQIAHRYLAKHASTAEETLTLLTQALSSKSLSEAQQAYRLLGEMKAAPTLREEALQLTLGKRRPEIQLDLIEAVQALGDPEALKSLADYEATKSTEDPLAPYRETLVGGDRKLGQGIFQTNVIAQCIRCHQHQGTGGSIGPDLTNVASRLTPEKLLESLVAPQTEIAAGYGLISLTLKDGTTLAGTLVEQNPEAYTVRSPTGDDRKIAANEVESATPAMSSMPPMGALLSKRELRDLMAHLVRLK